MPESRLERTRAAYPPALSGKLFLAYKTDADRLHVYDPSRVRTIVLNGDRRVRLTDTGEYEPMK